MHELKDTLIALQLWSLNNECKEDFFGTLRKVREMGYEGVEFAGFHGKSAAEVRKVLDELGLQATGAHVGCDQFADDKIKATLAYYREAGIRNLIVPYTIGQGGTVEKWREFINWLIATTAEVESAGFRLGYHNHDFEFTPLADGQIPFDMIFANTPPSVLLELDMGWAAHAGQDIPGIFRKYPGRSYFTHVKADSAGNPAARLGEDDVDWPAALAAAATTGYGHVLVVEHEKHGTTAPLENVKVCLDYLKGLRGN